MAPRNSAIVGVAAVGIGAVGMYGSLTGRLPAMLAAIFYPQLLIDQSGMTAAEQAKLPPWLRTPTGGAPSGGNPLTEFFAAALHAANPARFF